MEEVSAAYGAYQALFGVSMTVGAGEVVALLGTNGAGKSTVARVVTGLLRSTSGRVLIDGRELTNQPAHRVARAGVVHVIEGRGVFSRLTVEENLALAFGQLNGRKRVTAGLEEAYGFFPVLAQRRSQRAGTLSGGEQRMLSLSKAMVIRPQLIVADELSLGLAPGVVDTVYENLGRIKAAGTALLLVEQHVARALGLATSAVVLDHGSVAYSGPPSGAGAVVEELLAARRRAV